MEDAPLCHLCCNELDATDLASKLCACDFAICLWCWTKLCEETGRCPNCRALYDVERTRRQALDTKQLEEISQQKSKREDRRKVLTSSKSRRDLANMRVVQRNLVYVVGLSLDLCSEDTLRTQDYFGQFGRIVKISVSRAGPYGTSGAKHGPSGSAYVTFRQPDDARKCIAAVHGAAWEGKQVKACYGTTKYCNAFLKGMPCNNTDCLYLHAEAMDEDSYTKEQTKSAKFVSLVHAVSIASPAAKAAAAAAQHALAPTRLTSAASVSTLEEDMEGEPEPPPPQAQPVRTLSTASSWAARAAAGSSQAAAAPVHVTAPPPPMADRQAEDEWPTLPSTASGGLPRAFSTADPLPGEVPQANGKHQGGRARENGHRPVALTQKPASQWPALSSSPGSSWASAAEHLRPSQAPPQQAFTQASLLGSPPRAGDITPRALQPPSLQLDEQPEGSETPPDESEGGEDMVHGSGDDEESAAPPSSSETPSAATSTAGLEGVQPSYMQPPGNASIWQPQPVARSQSRFEFARQEGQQEQQALPAALPLHDLLLGPYQAPFDAPWQPLDTSGQAGWPSGKEQGAQAVPGWGSGKWTHTQGARPSEGGHSRSHSSQGSPESSSFSLSSRHWGHHMQPSWSDAELSLPASL